jgi:thiol-disulfide isomerase/thioredoxin
MKKFLADRTGIYQILLLLGSGMALLFFFEAELAAQSDSREIDRLFSSMDVIKVPPTKAPVIINLEDLNGHNVSLADFRGKVVFLNFWTTWCPTCRIEMPSMETLHRKLKDKDFAMVTVNLQESASQVKAFFKEFGLTSTALLDLSGEVGFAFGIRAIPTTYILDKTGRIIGWVNGPREWDSKDAIALFEKLIDNDAAAEASEVAK